MRRWRKLYAHLDEEKVTAELGDWLAEPRTNTEIRERIWALPGRLGGAVGADPLRPHAAAADPAPAGGVLDRRAARPVRPRPPARARSPRTPRCSCCSATSRRSVASRRDVAAWAGVAQRDFAEAFTRLDTVTFQDEHGTELHAPPGRPLPPADTPLPPRFLAHWDQSLLAYAQRDRIIPPELKSLQLTLSGDPTVTVDGRVAASWAIEREGDTARLTITPHVEFDRSAVTAEAERTARFCEPDATSVEVVYSQPRRWREGPPERGRRRRACRYMSAQMRADRAGRQRQLVRDLLVDHALGEALEDLELGADSGHGSTDAGAAGSGRAGRRGRCAAGRAEADGAERRAEARSRRPASLASSARACRRAGRARRRPRYRRSGGARSPSRAAGQVPAAGEHAAGQRAVDAPARGARGGGARGALRLPRTWPWGSRVGVLRTSLPTSCSSAVTRAARRGPGSWPARRAGSRRAGWRRRAGGSAPGRRPQSGCARRA